MHLHRTDGGWTWANGFELNWIKPENWYVLPMWYFKKKSHAYFNLGRQDESDISKRKGIGRFCFLESFVQEKKYMKDTRRRKRNPSTWGYILWAQANREEAKRDIFWIFLSGSLFLKKGLDILAYKKGDMEEFWNFFFFSFIIFTRDTREREQEWEKKRQGVAESWRTIEEEEADNTWGLLGQRLLHVESQGTELFSRFFRMPISPALVATLANSRATSVVLGRFFNNQVLF